MFDSAIFFILFLLCALCRGIAARECARTAPFSKDLIGKSFSSTGECYRPGSRTRISIYERMLVLKLDEGIRFFNCPETYLILYRTPSVTPMIVKWPPLQSPTSIRNSDDNNKWCIQNQSAKRLNMFPVHATRYNFTQTIKFISPILKNIRDFGCELDENGYWAQVQGRSYVNTDVQAIMTYLDNIAFQYSLCV